MYLPSRQQWASTGIKGGGLTRWRRSAKRRIGYEMSRMAELDRSEKTTPRWSFITFDCKGVDAGHVPCLSSSFYISVCSLGSGTYAYIPAYAEEGSSWSLENVSYCLYIVYIIIYFYSINDTAWGLSNVKTVRPPM